METEPHSARADAHLTELLLHGKEFIYKNYPLLSCRNSFKKGLDIAAEKKE